ncbi:MAG: alpha/beta fold hydrolase [Pseudomonadota bacterium]
MLTTIEYDGPGEVPLLIAHGLFGSARNWNVIAKRLSAHCRVLAVDMRNHGTSPWEASHSYPDLAGDLAEVISAHGPRAHVLGHSMGGKAAMCLALRHPSKIDRLCIADIAPTPYGHSQLPVVAALKSVDLSQVSRRSDADAQLAAHIPEAPLRAFLLQSLEVTTEGARWRLNLAALEDQMPQIMGFPEQTETYDGPALFLTGARSDYVQASHRPGIRALFSHASFAQIPNAGHWLHAEAPDAFLEAILRDMLP